jgi:hypothetical protein
MKRVSSRRRGRIPYIKGYYDFSLIKKISTSAALVLAATYDRNQRLSGINTFAVRLAEWHPVVRATMRELGFFDILNIEASVPVDPTPEQMILRFRAGSKVDPTQIGGPNSVIERMFAGRKVTPEPPQAQKK